MSLAYYRGLWHFSVQMMQVGGHDGWQRVVDQICALETPSDSQPRAAQARADLGASMAIGQLWWWALVECRFVTYECGMSQTLL